MLNRKKDREIRILNRQIVDLWIDIEKISDERDALAARVAELTRPADPINIVNSVKLPTRAPAAKKAVKSSKTVSPRAKKPTL